MMRRMTWSTWPFYLALLLVILIPTNSEAEDNLAEQLAQLAAAIDSIATCNMQCTSQADAESQAIRQAAIDVCTQTLGAPKNTDTFLMTDLDWSRCLNENTDQNAEAAVQNRASACRYTCFLNVADPEGTGMSTIALSEFDGAHRDAIQLCQINCFTNEDYYNASLACVTDVQSLEEMNNCNARIYAREALCGRSCTDPARLMDANTVKVTESEMNSQAYLDCSQRCLDENGYSTIQACSDAIASGQQQCPTDETTFIAQLCKQSTYQPGWAFCGQLNRAALQHCRFKCMSEHATVP